MTCTNVGVSTAVCMLPDLLCGATESVRESSPLKSIMILFDKYMELQQHHLRKYQHAISRPNL